MRLAKCCINDFYDNCKVRARSFQPTSQVWTTFGRDYCNIFHEIQQNLSFTICLRTRKKIVVERKSFNGTATNSHGKSIVCDHFLTSPQVLSGIRIGVGFGMTPAFVRAPFVQSAWPCALNTARFASVPGSQHNPCEHSQGAKLVGVLT